MSKLRHEPLNDFIVVRLASGEATSAGGIVLPDVKNSSNAPHGEVLAVPSWWCAADVGLDQDEEGLPIRPGDVIYFRVGKSLLVEGESLCIVDSSDVFSVLRS